METNYENREAGNVANRGGKKPGTKKKATRKSQVGRPPKSETKPEVERQIIHNDGKIVIEKCPLCAASVKLTVYATKGATRYATCPNCQQKLALRGDKARQI